ncbi:endonuclease/exonuclease/phosphatase family protein [Zavarzinella formosa]|uniref:endonuclease/exonuclease/phosphatase family protein n=1 Tax=Zavarzinella formosa TaxID=360055 RepID=UPI0012F72897|nr:endonuclease/exonuclease/phosphatase family protein [Zavarzinella formosa]
MADNRINPKDIQAVLQLLSKLPKGVVIALIVIVGIGYLVVRFGGQFKPHSGPGTKGPPGSILFCSWNAENFFDDTDNSNIRDEMEDWYGQNPDMFQLKVDHLATGLLMMNDGAGPEIIALMEVESKRCFEALRDALNTKLDAAGLGDKKYQNILFTGDNTGRHFAPGILTRLPVIADRTKKLGKHGNGRIVEGHIEVNGYDLTVIAAHWTSRVTDKDGDGDRRISYAHDCYGRVKAILMENPDADVILCGDFNDEFQDKSMQEGLNASADAEAVKGSADPPKMLALLANWSGDPKGSIYGKSHWSIFDHLCVTRGLLDDKGWSADPTSATIFAPKEFRTGRAGTPFRFGEPKATGPRGYSDHFPVTVRLNVAGS